MIKWLENFKHKLRKPKSKFKLNDCVHQRGNDTLMIVKEIYTSYQMKTPLILCAWRESGNVSRTNLFQEDALVLFDWESFKPQIKSNQIESERVK